MSFNGDLNGYKACMPFSGMLVTTAQAVILCLAMMQPVRAGLQAAALTMMIAVAMANMLPSGERARVRRLGIDVTTSADATTANWKNRQNHSQRQDLEQIDTSVAFMGMLSCEGSIIGGNGPVVLL